MANFNIAFDEVLVIMLLLWLCSGVGSGGGELEANELRTTETPRCSNRYAVANIATCKPYNIATTLTRVAGGQSIVDKAQKHNIFVKILFRSIWIVAFNQTLIKASTSQSHQVRLNTTILNPD